MQVYSINESLNGSTVLITGATGFIGGSLLERILRLSPGPKRVFVIARKRRGLEPQERFDSILASPLFSGLELRALEKVYVIPGDITVDGLNLSDGNQDLLLSSCTHVFHCAASLSFENQLEAAAKTNLLGTRYVLRLAKKMPKIQSMVHVSSAYANCTRNYDKILEERVYPSSIDARTFIDMIENMSSEEMIRRNNEFLGDHINTYTFTKQLAENLSVVERGNVPLSIVRPGITVNSWKQPMSGWVDNVNGGACGYIAGVTKGIFRTIHGEPEANADIIPVDMVVSTILAASIYTTRNPDKVQVFHCNSSASNPINWSQFSEKIVKSSRSHPCENALWYPKMRPRKNWLRNAIVVHVIQLLPAYILNILWQFKCPGEKYPLLKVQQKLAKSEKSTSHFTIRQWNFSDINTSALLSALSPSERNAHPMDPRDIEWDRFCEICVLGMRRYLFKQPAATTDRAMRQMKRLKIIAAVTPFIAFIVFWYLMMLLLPGSLSTTVTALLAGFIILFFMWL